jgi:hypothetical protein
MNAAQTLKGTREKTLSHCNPDFLREKKHAESWQPRFLLCRKRSRQPNLKRILDDRSAESNERCTTSEISKYQLAQHFNISMIRKAAFAASTMNVLGSIY